MSSTSNPLPSPIIHRWEEASAQLTNALSNYASSCLALESLPGLPKSSGAQNLSLDIDRMIDFVRKIAFEQLARSCSSLARTRSKLVTSIYSLPAEILSEVFRLVIYAPDEIKPLRMGIQSLYRRLHTLVSVCGEWRRVGLAQGTFWSIIPIIHDGRRDLDYATRLSLQRSGNSELHVAVDLGLSVPKVMAALPENAARFRTLNIKSKSYCPIGKLISAWLEYGIPGSVTELSICYAPDFPGAPEDRHFDNITSYLYSRQSITQRSLSNFMATLSSLRISGALLPLDNISFDRLAELRIANVRFSTQGECKAFLGALRSMPSLRALHIISVQVSSFPEPDTPENQLSISLPRLQTLYLEDIDPFFLRLTFASIAPGPYHIVLYACRMSFLYDCLDEDRSDPIVDVLLPALEGANVSTLMLDAKSVSAIGTLLGALPTLRSLFLESLPFDKWTMRALRQPSNSSPFPRLRELYVGKTDAMRPKWTELFKDIVSSHAFERMTLGGDPQERGANIFNEVLMGDDEIVTWLRSRVPNFRLIHYEDGLLQFKPRDMWQLW